MLALLLGAAPGITSPEVSGAVLFTDPFSAVTFVNDPRASLVFKRRGRVEGWRLLVGP
jgi:hypothetical protein